MRIQTNSPAQIAAGPGAFVTAGKASALMHADRRRIGEDCAAGLYRGAVKNDSSAWLIPIDSLPLEARARLLAQQAGFDPARPTWPNYSAISDEEASTLWERFESASKEAKERAQRDAEACHFWRLGVAEGKPAKALADSIAEQFDIKKSALYDKLARIGDYDPMHWPALLCGQWKGTGGRRVEWPAGAWAMFQREALTHSCKIRTAWRRTRAEAKRQGWGAIPSYHKAKADYERIDYDVRVLLKEGETALKARSPTAQRDYNALPLHDTWSMDGRRADLICIDRKGKYGKPGRVFRPWVYAYADVRSRYWLGHAIGPDLNSDSVRAGFLAALKTTGRIIPREIEPDNGREIAARENSGGTPWMRRWNGKKDPSGIVGLFPLLGIEIGWTTVAHGQAKIIERVFGTTGQMLETRAEFAGAYCGNTPDARPEEWDAAKAVDIERFEELLNQVVKDYNEEIGHRGQGMDGKSPHQVYSELIVGSGFAARKISAEQERLCTYSVEPITISKRTGRFTILGASYGGPACSKLEPGSDYYARYNPANLSDTVYVYRGEKRLCTAQKVELTGYNDKATAKKIMRDRASYIRNVKANANALKEAMAAEAAGLESQLPRLRENEALDLATGEITTTPALPRATVIQLVPTKADPLPKPEAARSKEDEDLSRRVAELDRQREQAAIDGLLMRAAVRR